MNEIREQNRKVSEVPCGKNRRESLQAPSASWAKTFIAALSVTLPAIFFYTILFRSALNLPVADDYEVLLNFLNQITLLKGASAKVLYFLAEQNNEYKIFFTHGVAWLQFNLFGHIDFRILIAVGDGFVLLLAILLWKMFLPTTRDFTSRLAYFIPVSWLLFQLQYWEDLSWATAALQHIPVLVFSLGAIYMLVRGNRWKYCCAVALLILAVASDGNGLIMIPIGLLILVVARRYARAASWLVVSAGCIAAYAYRYSTVASAHTDAHQSIFSTILRMNPAYVLAFLGSVGGVPLKPAASLPVGIILCTFFGYMAHRGYIRKNPLVAYCVLFLLLTAIGVAGIRSDFGVEQAVVSRYTIYSALLLIFAWFAIVEEFLQHKPASLFHNDVFLCAVAAVVLFCTWGDFGGWMQLKVRNRYVVEAMAVFENPALPNSSDGPSPSLFNGPNHAASVAYNQRARAILTESIKLGVYSLPPY